MPFESRFFQFINKRATVAPTVADNYAVTVAGQPINTNPDARILPHTTRLELQCSSGPQQLIYRNYPRSRIFNWSPEGCGNVNLEILVGDMILSQSYIGGKAFAKFLQTYAQGSRRFAPDDFPPEQSAKLKSYGIKYFIVGYQLLIAQEQNSAVDLGAGEAADIGYITGILVDHALA